MKWARRLDGVSESATLKLNAAVQQMKAQGIPVLNLSTGEPDFAVPQVVKEAVIQALAENRSKYTPVPGIPELREAIARKTNAQQPQLATPWKASNVVVTNGGKQAIFNSLLALLNPGDECLIPAPYWLSYPEMVKLAEGCPVIIPTRVEDGFKLQAPALEQVLTRHPRAKVLMLNSPSNPTGALYSRAEFEAMGQVLEQFPDVWILSDEIYDEVILGDLPFCSFLAANPALVSRTVTLNGLSKSGAMTGWRLGWAVAPSEMVNALVTLQGQSTSGICALTQWAGVKALAELNRFLPEWVKTYRSRRDRALEILSKAGTIKVFRPEGAFYLFIDVRSHLPIGTEGDATAELAEEILRDQKVAVVPGSPFGAPGWIRISFATEEGTLFEACQRLVDFTKKKQGSR